MKTAIFFLSFVLITKVITAQNNYGNVAVPYNAAPSTYLRDLFTTRVTANSYINIEGSAFLDENWLLARLVLPGNKIIDKVSIKLNLYENKVHFKNEDGQELQAGVAINEIKIIDSTSKWRNTIFISGLEEEKNSFFLLLTNGSKMKLLKKMSINRWETKSVGEVKRWFELDEKLFFWVNGNLIKSNKSCLAIPGVWENNKNVLQFISSNYIKCNKEEDMKKLVEYCNSL